MIVSLSHNCSCIVLAAFYSHLVECNILDSSSIYISEQALILFIAIDVEMADGMVVAIKSATPL